MMYHTTLNNRIKALTNNYIYINRNNISYSLICPICLDPLIDPQTHVLCENSFCNRCITKLRYCPCCQTTIIEFNDLIITGDVIRNALDELQIMQPIRQLLTTAIQRRLILIRPSLSVQQVRYDGSDPTTSNYRKSGKQSDPSKGSDLNKTKISDKKQRPNTVDDTKQPGTKREDWTDPNKITSNDPPYGKAGGSTDAHDPNRGKKP
ncbi:unnamed protein product [Rotaria sp. Silwood1]|nr:unnamed protein product [Rotaria sp. Silwood1]CAF1569479.1 unnamed protein product [Rotaria sp. Silwood1]